MKRTPVDEYLDKLPEKEFVQFYIQFVKGLLHLHPG